MHDHSHDLDDASVRPKGATLDRDLDPHVGRAAADGRVDALGAAGLLDLQRTAGNERVTALVEEERSTVLDVVSSGGRPMEPEVRSDMEGRLGHDFGDVRIHDDGAAHTSAASVQAHAYTVGSDLVFQRDAYDPASTAGRTTLAHELTHVVQQRSGPVDGTSAGGGIRVSDPGDRFERDAAANAERVMASPSGMAASPVSGARAALQRELDDSVPVQREDAPEAQEEEADESV